MFMHVGTIGEEVLTQRQHRVQRAGGAFATSESPEYMYAYTQKRDANLFAAYSSMRMYVCFREGQRKSHASQSTYPIAKGK